MQYQALEPISLKDAAIAFSGSDPEKIRDALFRLTLQGSDWKTAQENCLRLIVHSSTEVRAAAATCLGHVARLHQNLDMDLVLPVLNDLLEDPDVAEYAQDSLDDIRIFMKYPLSTRHRL